MMMAFSWDWTQRVHVSDKVVYVEWRHVPPTTWFIAHGLRRFDLDVSSPSCTPTLRQCRVIESHVHELRPGHELCVSVQTSTDPHVRTRAVCVLACYHLLLHPTSTAADAWIPFGTLHVVPFFDALSSLHVLDCVRGLEKARAAGLVVHDHIEASSFTWLSKKLVTFPSPSGPCAALEAFLPFFYAHNVTLILALHPPVYCYDTLDGAIEYMDLFDSPSADLASVDAMLARVHDAVESTPGVVAIHGLHRARTFLGGYFVRCHGFSAEEAAGWLHVAHPHGDIHAIAPDPLFPHALRRWQRRVASEPDRPRDQSRRGHRDAVPTADQRPTSSSSLKINIGGLSFGSSLLLGSSTAKNHDKASSRKRLLTPSRSKEGSDLGGTTSRGHSRERTAKSPVQS
ncbi:hypothetical protein H310_02574 [Aphanomyces invadans]|uniref:Uncharacterized protein n=1 Tax=Aphanomyces invadans TaxID=157072 RepID=A0A024UJA7_9STRA|nr:hypothetical protein H310_02574 [Aphanomyces invadans]ETW06280.1 hypothetical protein H310_02574 [Aphanomyces invadans]|eukprot:XP_008864355.1 hypothetical protein H310_02574 [Aphanomyces invadans]